jgi:hypothetical protein
MRIFRLERSEPILDIASYGRSGPQQQIHLTPTQVEQIRRTVTYAPEVMIKVTGGRGACGRRGVQAHIGYISRGGELEIETDDGECLEGAAAPAQLVENWDLDLDRYRTRADLSATSSQSAPKLVHRIIFSMPAGTPPAKVQSAVRDFAREEFGGKHRYAMVLHTDEPHPHVHVLVKAVSERGKRLNIRKATLRDWRQKFAWHLREHGIKANATDRAVRGRTNPVLKDGIYRAAKRGASTHMENKIKDAVACFAERRLPVEPSRARMIETRRSVVQGWRAVAQALDRQGERPLAEGVVRFVKAMRPPRTERELVIEHLVEQTKARVRSMERTR